MTDICPDMPDPPAARIRRKKRIELLIAVVETGADFMAVVAVYLLSRRIPE